MQSQQLNRHAWLIWTFLFLLQLSRHKCFPKSFTGATREFLKSHKALERLHAYKASSLTPASPREDTVPPAVAAAEALALCSIKASPFTSHSSQKPFMAACQAAPSRDPSCRTSSGEATLISISATEGAQVTATVTLSPRKRSSASLKCPDYHDDYRVRSPGKSRVSIRVFTSGDMPMEATVQVGAMPSSALPPAPSHAGYIHRSVATAGQSYHASSSSNSTGYSSYNSSGREAVSPAPAGPGDDMEKHEDHSGLFG